MQVLGELLQCDAGRRMSDGCGWGMGELFAVMTGPISLSLMSFMRFFGSSQHDLCQYLGETVSVCGCARACADGGECVFCDMCQRVTLLCCVPHTGVPRPIINAFNRPSWLGGESRNRFSFFLKV